MSFFVKSVGASYGKNVGSIRYPVLRGLLGAYIFDSVVNQLVNWAPGGSPLTKVGTPTTNPLSVTVSGGTNYFDTGVLETSDMTLVAIFKKENATSQTSVFGNRNSDAAVASIGTSINKYANLAHLEMGQTGGASAVQHSLAGVADGAAVFAAVRAIGSTTVIRGSMGHGGTLVHGDAGTGYVRQVEPAVTMKVGPGPGIAWANACDIYAAAVHNLVLSDEEISQVYTFMRTKYAALGVTL